MLATWQIHSGADRTVDRAGPVIAVVIPAYNVEKHIAGVIGSIPRLVSLVVVVDDKSPDDVARRVQKLNDPRVVLLRHETNQGVGGAMGTGYRECMRLGADIVVKMDGDGQMDPGLLPALVLPLLQGAADYTKGNRWRDQVALKSMPSMRRWGNVALSFLTKVASGHWKIFDPCNGYTAIRASVLRRIPLEVIARDYFFETSMLVELRILGARVRDVCMPACYGDEESSMRLWKVLRRFPRGLFISMLRRIWQCHFVHDFGPIAIFLVFGLLLSGWGVAFGAWSWTWSVIDRVPATAGQVMLAAMPLLMGFQLLLQAAVLDIAEKPTQAPDREVPLADGDRDDVEQFLRNAA